MDAVQWLVLDNLAHGWFYTTNICDKDKAERMYLKSVEDEFIKDGRITDAGRIALMLPRVKK